MANAQTLASFGPGMLCSAPAHRAVFMRVKINAYLREAVEFRGMGAHLLDGLEGFALEGEPCCSPCAGGL